MPAQDTITLAVLGDLHDGGALPTEGRILLQRAVAHLNDMVRPDVTVFLGDLLEDGTAPDAATRRETLQEVLDELEGPCLVLPGNHDGPADRFYCEIQRHYAIEEVAGIRFVTFLDRDEPGFHASRDPAHLDRLRVARDGFDGPVVALQHVPVFAPGTTACPYNHLDADAILRAMRRHGVTLCLSAHGHAGHPPLREGPTTLFAVPALSVAPFTVGVVRLRHGAVEAVDVETLKLPDDPPLADLHVHTQFAYCGRDAHMARAVDIARVFGLHTLGLAEHSGQLYYSAEDYWSGLCHAAGTAGIKPADSRMDAYFAAAAAARRADALVGLEVDAGHDGTPVLLPRDRERADYLIGAMHRLQSLRDPLDPAAVYAEFRAVLDGLLDGRMDILAHPFRLLNRRGLEVSPALMDHVADRLAATGTAAEINFHQGGPPLAFVQRCLDRGVRFSLAGDAHNLFDIGNLAPHVDLLRRAGVTGDPSPFLFLPPREPHRL